MLTLDSAQRLRSPRHRGPLPDPAPQAGEGEGSDLCALHAGYFVRCAVSTAILKSCASAPEMSWSVETWK